MSQARIAALRDMVAKDPKDAMARRMLAEDLYHQGVHAEAVAEMEAYLKLQEDEGSAYRILGDALAKLGKKKEARWAFRHGAEAARAHNHIQLAEELEERVRELLRGRRTT